MFPDVIRFFRTLPKSGRNAKYVSEIGLIITGKKPSGIKSLDFTWMVGNTHIRCYAAHKVTRESGGAQDHQRNELLRLLQTFKRCTDEKIALFAICDGPYYNEHNLSMLREHVRKEPPFSFACPIGDVPIKVEKLLKDMGN